jgi:hypothetical protein
MITENAFALIFTLSNIVIPSIASSGGVDVCLDSRESLDMITTAY